MEKEKLDYLNYELNRLFLRLSKKNIFIHDNLDIIRNFSADLYAYLKDKDLSDEDVEQTYLTYSQVFELGRKIIEDFNPEYLEEYDKLIDTGVLNFSYESEYFATHYCVYDDGRKEINLNRKFNYSDVRMLVHEFIHLMSRDKNKNVQLLDTFDEFFSIYVESYVIDYLEKMGVSPRELEKKERLKILFSDVKANSKIEVPIIAYNKFGKLTEVAQDVKEYFIPDMVGFDLYLGVNRLYEKLKHIEEISDDEDVIELLKYGTVTLRYKYVLGVLLTYYARKNCTLADIAYIQSHLDEYSSELDVFKKMGLSDNPYEIYDEAISQIESEFGFEEKKK